MCACVCTYSDYICGQVFVWHKLYFLLDKYLWVEGVGIGLILRKLLNCFSGWLHRFAFPAAVYESSGSSSSAFGILSLWNVCHLNRHVMITDFLTVLICLSLMTNNFEYVFMCLFTVCISFLVKSSNDLHIFELFHIIEFWEFFNTYWYKSFTSYLLCRDFLQVWACIFILLIMSFEEQKFLTLVKFNFIYFKIYYIEVDIQCCVNFCSTYKKVTELYILFHILCHHGLLQDTGCTLCPTVGPCFSIKVQFIFYIS